MSLSDDLDSKKNLQLAAQQEQQSIQLSAYFVVRADSIQIRFIDCSEIEEATMSKIILAYTDRRFDGTDFNDDDKANVIRTMIEEGVLDLRDEFVSGLAIEVAGN